jgi:hypothetical protein
MKLFSEVVLTENISAYCYGLEFKRFGGGVRRPIQAQTSKKHFTFPSQILIERNFLSS